MIIWILIVVMVLYFAVKTILIMNAIKHRPLMIQTDKSLGAGPELKYIAAGDSTAVGLGGSSLENSYPYKIAAELSKTNTVNYKNVAVSGYKTRDILANSIEQIISYSPDIVTISIGANDATHLVNAETILQNYKKIIERLKQGTHAKIYITNIANFTGATRLPWFYILLLENRSKKINPKILALEDDRIKIINIHDFGWDQPPYKDRSRTYSGDHFHPNDLGYQNWANAFLNKMMSN